MHYVFYGLNLCFLPMYLCVEMEVLFPASTVCLSLRHTLALSQSVTLTLYCKQVVQGQFVMYLHILLFLSISRGT